MKKVNFRTFENLSVSEELLQKALSIPENAKSAPVSYSRTKSLMTAAGFVLVFALSLFLFFLFGNKNAIPIAPSSVQNPPYSTAADTPTASQAENTEPSAPENSASSQPQTEIATELSTDAEGNIIVTVITRIITTEEDPTEGNHAEPGENSSRPAQSENTPQTEKPDDTVSTESASKPPETKTEVPMTVEPAIICIGIQLPDEIRLNEQYVYCKIIDRNGNILGSQDLYASDHRVPVFENISYVEFIPQWQIYNPFGCTYYFYTKDGTVFQEGELW